VIDIEVREPTARLTLNAVNTTFASVTADTGAERVDVALDAAAETATFTLRSRSQRAQEANDCNARRFWERCLARAFRIAMTDKLSRAGHISDHG
jgi:hypothetical protein